jgi:hypothetical protein
MHFLNCIVYRCKKKLYLKKDTGFAFQGCHPKLFGTKEKKSAKRTDGSSYNAGWFRSTPSQHTFIFGKH